jgi:hypothetical protein
MAQCRNHHCASFNTVRFSDGSSICLDCYTTSQGEELRAVIEAAQWVVDLADESGVPVNRLAAFVPLQIIRLLEGRLAVLKDQS